MNSFNFSTLPYPAFQMIIKYLTPAEIFHLAFNTNEHVFNRLASSNSREVFCLIVYLTKDEKSIYFRFPNDKFNFTVAFSTNQQYLFRFTVINPNSTSQLLTTFGSIRKLFNGPIRMTLDLETLNKEAMSQLMEIPFAKLTVVGEMPPKTSRTTRLYEVLRTCFAYWCGKKPSENLTNEEIVKALKQFKPTEEYCIESDIGSKILPTLPSQKLSLHFAHGVNGTDLLNMAGKIAKVELLRSTLTSQDVNTFLKMWMGSTETTTVSLRVSKKNEELWCIQQVLQDIPNSAYQAGTRDRSFVTGRSDTGVPNLAENMSLARDIVRADGLRGSIRIAESELFFCVWHTTHEISTKIVECEQKINQAQQTLHELEIQLRTVRPSILVMYGKISRKKETLRKVPQSSRNRMQRIRLTREISDLHQEIDRNGELVHELKGRKETTYEECEKLKRIKRRLDNM